MNLLDSVVKATGKSEADIKSVDIIYHMPAYTVRLWNRRRLIVSDYDLWLARGRRPVS